MNNYIFIITAPSGAGKSSLLKAILETDIGKDNYAVAISHTTIEPRVGEITSREYYIDTVAEFEQLLSQDGFIEYSKVF
ncbi:guanylate kinase, partial [Francisella tularensis subsp. holarctica]|nr:guanylate kinase [Francisella tularensis subsp. holarctica]